MRRSILLTFTAVFLLTSCTSEKRVDDERLSFEKHIKFNHLFIVVDDSTYKDLSDTIDLIKEFSSFKESNTETETESWSGKYLHGKNHYLEIFRPAGYEGAKIGDFGMGFMPNKLGTIDSLYKHWTLTLDSVDRTERNAIENGVTFPWFTALSIPTRDTLKVNIWLMENRREEMLNAGFKESDLKNEIEFWDYLRFSRAKKKSTDPDSIKYDKLFDRVRTIKLRLSTKEFNYLKSNLLDFGFVENKNSFHGNDVDIEYELTEAEHFILRQIDFQLTRVTSDKEIKINQLTINITGDKASFMFNY